MNDISCIRAIESTYIHIGGILYTSFLRGRISYTEVLIMRYKIDCNVVERRTVRLVYGLYEIKILSTSQDN